MKTHQLIEALESRIAPAAIVNPTTVVFQDIDGDDVKIHVSKPIFTDPAAAAKLVIFTGSNFGDSGPQNLSGLNFAKLGAKYNGLDVFVTAKHSPTHGGNGAVVFDYLNASDVNIISGAGPGIDLGKVVVQGDVRYVDAGDEVLGTTAIKMLDLRTLGAVLASAPSDMFGSIAKVKIRGTMQGYLRTNCAQGNPALAGIGSIDIGGSMGSLSGIAGILDIAGGIGRLTLAGDLIGGGSFGSGVIKTGGDIKSLVIGGSIVGGTGQGGGKVSVGGHLASTVIGNSLFGAGNGTGALIAASIGSLKIGHDIAGGYDSNSGVVFTTTLAKLRIGGSIIGGANSSAGAVRMTNGTVEIGGSIIGSLGDQSGYLQMQDGSVAIKGSIIGGQQDFAGAVRANNLSSFTLAGSLIGGPAAYTGLVYVDGKISGAAIGGSVRGQTVPQNEQCYVATVFSNLGIGNMTIQGDLIAGNIVTGLSPGGDLQYGTPDDTDLSAAGSAKIGRLIVKGTVSGTPLGGADSYGIEAEEFGMVKIGGVTYRQGDAGTSGPLDYNKGFRIAATGDVLVRAV